MSNPSVIDLVDPYQQEITPVSRIVIASIFPLEMVESRKFFPQNQFVIRASESAPTTLVVRNQWEWTEQPLRSGKIRKVVPVEDIANDLMNKWTESMPHCTTGCHPGVWICRDAAGNYADTYREEEVKAARTIQEAYARVWMEIGDKAHFAQKPAPDLAKALAKWLGVPKPWLQTITTESFKPCSYCTEVIPGNAVICPKCQQVVDVEAWAKREAAKREATEKYIQSIGATVTATALPGPATPLPPPLVPLPSKNVTR